MAYRTRNITLSLYGLYSLYDKKLIRSVTIKHTDRSDRTNRKTLCPGVIMRFHPPYVLRIRTDSNADGFYGVYDPLTALNGRNRAAVLDMHDFCL